MDILDIYQYQAEEIVYKIGSHNVVAYKIYLLHYKTR